MKHFFNTKQIFNLFLSATLLAFSLSANAFTDMDGKKDDISNHIGKNKWTIVEIWESNCFMCRRHMPEMVKFNGKLKNARILGISLDGQEGVDAAEDFIAEYNVNFPNMLSNPIEMDVWMQQNVGERLIGTPTFMLFDAEGKLVAAQPGVVSTESLESFITQNSAGAQTSTSTSKTDKKPKDSPQYAYDGTSD